MADFHLRHFPEDSEEERNFRFTRAFRSAFHLWRHLLEGRLREFGTTRAKWSVLSSLVSSGGGENQNTLAKQLGIEGPTLVRLLDDLEESGLVARLQNPSDRRAKTIVATEKGQEFAELLVNETKHVRADFVSNLTESEISQLTSLLEKAVKL